MTSFVKQFCFPNDDEHRRYLAHLRVIAKNRGKSESWAIYQAVKRYVDTEMVFIQSDLVECQKIEDTRRAEASGEKQVIKPKEVVCEECGATRVDVDEYGFILHKPQCSNYLYYIKTRELFIAMKEKGG